MKNRVGTRMYYSRLTIMVITTVRLSAEGVAPIPKQLTKTAAFLTGKRLTEQLIQESTTIAQTEISPIRDAHCTETYKRLLLSQLIKAYFIKLFPMLKVERLLITLAL